MFSLRSLLAVAVAAPLVSGCGLVDRMKGGAVVDAGVDAAAGIAGLDAGGPPVAIGVAENVNDVGRFPDEVALPNVPAKIADASVTARNGVPSGAVVATLHLGAMVQQIASHESFVLCLFTDPKNSARVLEGWLGKEAFVAGPTAPSRVTCPPANPTRFVIDDQPFCGKQCTADKDCPSGQTCSGKANLYVEGKAGAAADNCTVPVPGALPASPSASGAPSAGLTIAGVQEPPLPAGGCEANYVLASDHQCHRNCARGVVPCPPRSRCIATLTNPGQPVCAEAR